MAEHAISEIFFEIFVLLSSAVLLGRLAERLYIPRVAGELSAGILWGPTALGSEAFEFFHLSLDRHSEAWLLIYWLSLTLMMLTAGIHVANRTGKTRFKILGLLIVGSTLIPFVVGLLVANWFQDSSGTTVLVFSGFLGLAACVTSLPVISKIFADLGILDSVFAGNVIRASAVQEVVVWSLFSILLVLHQAGSYDLVGAIPDAIFAGVFIAVSLMIAPILLRRARKGIAILFPGNNVVSAVFLFSLGLVLIGDWLNLDLLISALISGVLIGKFEGPRIGRASDSIGFFTLGLFAPLFFALVGYQLDLSKFFSMSSFLLFLFVSSVVKISSVNLLLRLGKLQKLQCLDYGFAMNTRGGPGIVLASIGFSNGIIDEIMFTTLVLVSIATAVIAGVWLGYRRNMGYVFS